jgi:serine/threonine protein kinase
MTGYKSLASGEIIAGRFQLNQMIGTGKSSAVYSALDLQTQTIVALKILDPFLAQDATSVERFTREVEIIRRLNQPNVIKVYDAQTSGEIKFIVMEYFPSQNGKEWIAAQGPMPLEKFLKAAQVIVEVVRSCHELGIIHRDLKPQNILFSTNGDLKLVDFGISRMNSMSDLTKTGTLLGSPEYMSPESFISSHTDRRRDIYALGTVFYEFLCGHPAFTGTSLAQIMTQHAKSAFKPVVEVAPLTPVWLSEIISKCLKKDPIHRYQSCEELQADLARGQSSLAVFENSREAGKCLGCQSDMLPALVFCHACGKFLSQSYQGGSHSVILYQTDFVEPVKKYIVKSFPGISALAVQNKLRKLPALVISGVSANTAQAIANELNSCPVVTDIVKSVPRQFRLSGFYFFVAALGLLPLTALYRAGILLQIAGVCSAEGLILAYFTWKTVPIIRLKKLASRIDRRTSSFLTRIAAEIGALQDARLQAILGRIALAYQNLRASNEEALTAGSWKRLEVAILRCLEMGDKTALLSRYLKERSVVELKRKLSTVEFKLKEPSSLSETHSLIELKSELHAEYENYRANQERYDDLIHLLLSFYESLRAFCLSVEQRSAAATALDLICEFQWAAKLEAAQTANESCEQDQAEQSLPLNRGIAS